MKTHSTDIPVQPPTGTSSTKPLNSTAVPLHLLSSQAAVPLPKWHRGKQPKDSALALAVVSAIQLCIWDVIFQFTTTATTAELCRLINSSLALLMNLFFYYKDCL